LSSLINHWENLVLGWQSGTVIAFITECC